MEQFCVELISKMKKSIDFGISAKQSYIHVLWQGNYLEGFEVSKQLFSREIDVAFRILLKIETTFLERVNFLLCSAYKPEFYETMITLSVLLSKT